MLAKHLHHADERADHTECRCTVSDGAIDLLALVEMGQEIVADKVCIVAVGDEADALGQEGIIGLDFLQPDRTLLAGDFRQPRKFVDHLALAGPAQRKGKLRAERQAMKDRRNRNRMSVAAKEPPKMMMIAWTS